MQNPMLATRTVYLPWPLRWPSILGQFRTLGTLRSPRRDCTAQRATWAVAGDVESCQESLSGTS